MVIIGVTYVTGKTVFAEAQSQDSKLWLVPDGEGGAVLEEYDADKDAAGDYRIPVPQEIGTKGIYNGEFPSLAANDLPNRFHVVFYDEDSLRAIGIGDLWLNEDGEEIDVMDTLFSGMAGRNEGVGTNTEKYFGASGIQRIASTFDDNGNRSEVIHGPVQ